MTYMKDKMESEAFNTLEMNIRNASYTTTYRYADALLLWEIKHKVAWNLLIPSPS